MCTFIMIFNNGQHRFSLYYLALYVVITHISSLTHASDVYHGISLYLYNILTNLFSNPNAQSTMDQYNHLTTPHGSH